MLLSWDACLPSRKARSSITDSNKPSETPEQRELRLRKQYEQALEAHRCHQTAIAKRQFEAIVDELPAPQLVTKTNRSGSHLHEKRQRNSTSSWERRLRFAVHRNLGESCFEMKLYPEAMAAFGKALDDDRSDFLVWVRAARSATRCGRWHVARRAYEKALILRPGHFLCTRAYKAVLQAIGDADEDVDRDRANLDKEVIELVEQRIVYWELELKAIEKQQPEVIKLQELTWACLVDELRVCLERRLKSGDDTPIGHPVSFEFTHVPSKSVHNGGRRPEVEEIHDSSDDVEEHEDLGNEEDDSDIVEVPVTTDVIDLSNDEDMPDVEGNEESIASPSSQEMVDQVAGDEADQNKSEALGKEIPHQSQKESEHRDTDTSTHASKGGPKDLTEEQGQHSNDHTSLMNKSQGQGEKNLNTDTDLGPGSPKELDNPKSPEIQVDGQASEHREGSNRKGVITTHIKKEPETVRRPEVRRSSRHKQQNSSSEGQRQTRTLAEARLTTQEDQTMIESMLKLCLGENFISNSAEAIQVSDGTFASGNGSPTLGQRKTQIGKGRSTSWVKVVDEREEASAVQQFTKSIETKNGGPADLLLRVLTCISKLMVIQYAPTVALLWSTLRAKLHIHIPDSCDTTAMIVEALLVSGKKAGKAKAKRFQEARRLLSEIRFSTGDLEDASSLKIRLAWLWSHLHECLGEMQKSFSAAEHTLHHLENMKSWRNTLVPNCLGPDLSGYTYEDLLILVNRRISGLRMARDLEKAQQELSKIGEGDEDAAKRTVSILSPSIHTSIRQLLLDAWTGEDLKVEFSKAGELERWEKRLDAESELESQLAVFSEACTKSSDIVGELVCYSVRLRMAVHYYSEKLRSEMSSEGGFEQVDDDSSNSRMADLLGHIRKFVQVVKRLAHSARFDEGNAKISLSGWTVAKAAEIASITLVSLVSLIITKIPLLKYSSGNTELGASEKNKRLAFTRCMLAFARCSLLINKSKVNTQESLEKQGVQSESPKEMLRVTAFCLKALVARGCCREEGTSGALIKLYAKYLCIRLQELALAKEEDLKEKLKISQQSTEEMKEEKAQAIQNKELERSMEDASVSSSLDAEHEIGEWEDVGRIRHELSQCFQCLYQIPELESISGQDDDFGNEERWLENGCNVSKHIGLYYNSGDVNAAGPVAMEMDVCKDLYLFYRRHFFDNRHLLFQRRRDGGRAKRLRDLMSRLSESLPEDPPSGFRMLSFQALDNIVTDVIEQKEEVSGEAAETVARLENEWDKCTLEALPEKASLKSHARNAQFSTTMFEVFILHAVSALSEHDAEYKKHKTAERRKRPKEVAERLFAASSECLIALRCRPWSIGAWILLGRIFVEISDLALDERELGLSSFGSYRSEDLATLDDGDLVETVFGRAEACFSCASALHKHTWTTRASMEQLEIPWSNVLGLSFDGSKASIQDGLGDDGDLFGSLGLTNYTTSRPVLSVEHHPGSSNSRATQRFLASIRLGEAAVSILRLREMRYFHTHWTNCAYDLRPSMQSPSLYPEYINNLGELALKQIRAGNAAVLKSSEQDPSFPEFAPPGSSPDQMARKRAIMRNSDVSSKCGYVRIEQMRWYYMMKEASLIRKCGGNPEDFLSLFSAAVEENKKNRSELRQSADIEPVYKLHAARAKLLRYTKSDTCGAKVLTLLEKYPFSKQKASSSVVDVDLIAEKDLEDHVYERKVAIAEDILSAMQACCSSKSDVQYAEYYFKAVYCRAVILSEVLNETKGALEELEKLFRTDAAAKVLDQGPDGSHRGYFFRIWNYRITDTGLEPAIESERKLVRWRTKALAFYAGLLKRTGEWRLLAAIVFRLKKRMPEDLPVDGALLDDLIGAYATTCIAAILNSISKGIFLNPALFESSFRRTWDIYVETLRLAQGIKRVRISLSNDEKSETGGGRLIESGRPRCLTAITTALRLELLRWKTAQGEIEPSVEKLRELPTSGHMDRISSVVKLQYIETMKFAMNRWPLDDKMTRLLKRRINEYTRQYENS